MDNSVVKPVTETSCLDDFVKEWKVSSEADNEVADAGCGCGCSILDLPS